MFNGSRGINAFTELSAIAVLKVIAKSFFTKPVCLASATLQTENLKSIGCEFLFSFDKYKIVQNAITILYCTVFKALKQYNMPLQDLKQNKCKTDRRIFLVLKA